MRLWTMKPFFLNILIGLFFKIKKKKDNYVSQSMSFELESFPWPAQTATKV